MEMEKPVGKKNSQFEYGVLHSSNTDEDSGKDFIPRKIIRVLVIINL